MATITGVTRCLLCNDAIEDGDVRGHLRVVHEVAVGEATRADVPCGYPSPLPVKAAERPREEEAVALTG